MAFNIDAFKKHLMYGGARSDLFQVHLYGPGWTNAIEKAAFMCKAASLPAMTNTPVQVRYFGRAIKLSANREFADWRVTIINDEDWTIRRLLEDWVARLNTPHGNANDFGASPDVSNGGYKCSAEVHQFSKGVLRETAKNEAGQETVTVKAPPMIASYLFEGLFPISVDEIPVSWDDEKVQEYGVTFSVDLWQRVAATDTADRF
jgi:hypothetical protein